MYIQKGKARTTQYTMTGAQNGTVPAINAQSVLPQSLPNIDTTIPQQSNAVKQTEQLTTDDMRARGYENLSDYLDRSGASKKSDRYSCSVFLL